jgi:hypothetical protein
VSHLVFLLPVYSPLLSSESVFTLEQLDGLHGLSFDVLTSFSSVLLGILST